MKKDEQQAALKSVIISAVELLKEQGLENAGTVDGLLAYQVLGDIATNAAALDIPLADLGLDGFDLDSLLRLPAKAA